MAMDALYSTALFFAHLDAALPSLSPPVEATTSPDSTSVSSAVTAPGWPP